ncbi:MAG: hypothetical protein JF586_09655 [Burkholderiales bacterium]|nr:hypothetical protein [Burkholderiales bacterium]
MNALRHDPAPGKTALPLVALAVGLGALGVLSLGSGDFAFQWQPVPPDMPSRSVLATATGGLEVAAAVLLLLSGRLRAVGAWLAAVLLLGWVALHVPVVVQRPASIADWLGLAETAAMASAALMFAAAWAGIAAAGAIRRGAFVAFGSSALVFGLAHFKYAEFTASMIPHWLPERLALAWFTGAAHALAGVAILTGWRRSLAAWLECLMMAGFVALVHVPRVLAHPDSRMEWTMLFVAVTLSASAGLVAAMSGRGGTR